MDGDSGEGLVASTYQEGGRKRGGHLLGVILNPSPFTTPPALPFHQGRGRRGEGESFGGKEGERERGKREREGGRW